MEVGYTKRSICGGDIEDQEVGAKVLHNTHGSCSIQGTHPSGGLRKLAAMNCFLRLQLVISMEMEWKKRKLEKSLELGLGTSYRIQIP
jgi:hypothetical protein